MMERLSNALHLKTATVAMNLSQTILKNRCINQLFYNQEKVDTSTKLFSECRNMIGVFESKFLLVTIICSVPILSVLTVKIMSTRCSLGSKLNTNVRTRTCNYSES